MVYDAVDQIEKFQEFFEKYYFKDITNAASQGKRAINIDFFELTKFDMDLAEQLLEEPKEVIKTSELGIEQFDIAKPLKARFFNFPESQKILIRNIRSFHLGKFIAIEGFIIKASNVWVQAESIKFECPDCGNTITIFQNEKKVKKPTKCTCGRKGHFRMLTKDLEDVREIIIEEPKKTKEKSQRLKIILKGDLVEPHMINKTKIGKKVEIIGILKDRPDAKSKLIPPKLEIIMDANNIRLVNE